MTLLQNGAQIFPAMLEAIRSAQRTITFENFVWHEGRVARALPRRWRSARRPG